MSIHVALHHRTHYEYDRPIIHSPHLVRLRPAPHCRTPILSYSLKVGGGDPFVNWVQDPFSNWGARLVFPEKLSSLTIEVDLVVEMAVFNPFDYFLEEYAEKFPFSYDDLLHKELVPFLETLPETPAFGKYCAGISRKTIPTNDWIVMVNQSLSRDIGYVIRMEPGVQTPEETLTNRSGSCRDTAWLLVQILRHHGLAARFVSGYLIQLKPDVAALDGPSGTEVDFTDLHAWCEVYLPGGGWIGLDPTSGLLAGEGHIPVACTPDPSGAAPVSGATEKCESTFEHEMGITRIYESPRVTKPYTPEQWADIEALGHSVDDALTAGDVRLTMGGEPTFVSIDDMEGEEWNFTAAGPEKRRLCSILLRRLQKHFAPGGLLHHGQGKWYPGEPLPRWSYGCWWRHDGQPLWQDPALLADMNEDYGHTPEDALAFLALLTKKLAITDSHIIAGYEDVYYYLWREKRLPGNVDPLDAKLDDELERDRLYRLFTQGLDKIVGYALPLKRDPSGAWVTGSWFLRREHLFLFPGDSPMGLRLPLDSLPWVAESEYPWIYPDDPFLDHAPLPSPQEFRSRLARQPDLAAVPPVTAPGKPAAPAAPAASPDPDRQARIPGQPAAGPPATGMAGPDAASYASLHEMWNSRDREPLAHESAAWITRTALCAEPREGKLHLFIPPLVSLTDYLDLITAIEATAAELRMPVILEGSPPPYDPRVDNLKVTPDPGVIEVNLQPAKTWQALVFNTTTLYEEARLSRLGTEKFMIDGRHVGTGGGNHIVVGAATPAESPFLRRPDVLRSLLIYWQNHPALSFLFSGLFIGPTSQHPRIDEARNDALYELEIAFQQIPETGSVPPWLVDRIFRDLLIDSAGNTHRAEFCIDKLFSPDSSTGRLGLLELRAFEMPPHAQMSLVQQLLLRTLIAWFWEKPLNRPLVRWGTELHDRFLLSHFVREDMADIITDLQDAGFPMQWEWFAPHFEFRFPLCGHVSTRGIHLELRQALEPWHVLGEQGTPAGATRYVDSSVERLQVKVSGLTGSRHVILCNGRPVPLHPTGIAGEFVAGVRFRAWQPPVCLHPTIPVQAPLTFDILDTWNQRSVGGCTWHVTHPGGRSYETLPVNAFEAESRRLNRFFTTGHTPGRITPPAPPVRTREFPYTLDLRRA